MVSDSPPSKSELIVRKLYQGILGREPEPTALSHWIERIDQNMDFNDVLDSFLTSDEFHTRRVGSRLAYPPGHFYSPVVDPAAIETDFRLRWSSPVEVVHP
jgi:hypothetical protein